jgi:hypothetical protein
MTQPLRFSAINREAPPFLDGVAKVSSYLGALSEAFRWPVRDEQDPEIHTGALPRATNGRNLGHLSCHEDFSREPDRACHRSGYVGQG